jgi:hypothetical protein
MGNIEIYNINPIPVLAINLDQQDWFTMQEMEFLKNIPTKTHFDAGTGLSKSSQVIAENNLLRIKNVFEKYATFYLNEVVQFENYSFKLTQSWLTINYKGTYHPFHIHYNSMLTATWYFNEDYNDSSMSSFQLQMDGYNNIFRNFQFHIDLKKDNDYNCSVYTFKPRNNLMIVFPSWMKHGTVADNIETKRYCLGANFFINDNIGDYNHYSDLNIRV